jgi:hypothetical protein
VLVKQLRVARHLRLQHPETVPVARDVGAPRGAATEDAISFLLRTSGIGLPTLETKGLCDEASGPLTEAAESAKYKKLSYKKFLIEIS